jgi:uncharacterized protein
MGIAIVTGASSGIGKEFALQMPQNFELDEIWVLARRKDRLKKLGKTIEETKVVVVEADLTSDSDIKTLKKKLKEEKPTVVALINNAGVGLFEKFEDQELDEIKETIDLNVTALTELTYITLPYMGKGGAIVQVASVLADIPFPGYATYAATKSYVLSFAQALGLELEEKGIHVMALCPGPTKTEFFKGDKLNGESPKDAMEPELLVKKAIKALTKKKKIFYPNGKWSSASFFARVLPRSITHRIVKNKSKV